MPDTRWTCVVTGFATPLLVEINPSRTDGRLAVLTAPLVFGDHTVPAGYVTDFGSIPWFLRWLISPFGPHAPATVLHDYKYALQDVSRQTADRLFLEAMTHTATPPWMRTAMYWAVRIGGAKGWKNERGLTFGAATTGGSMEPIWMRKARADMGVHEVEGDGSHPRIAAMFAQGGFAGQDDGKVPWCGIAMSAWMRESGIAPPVEGARARAWLEWGEPLAKPVPGCVAIYTRTNNPQHGHVALFLSHKDGRDMILGGNQSDGVSITSIASGTGALLGYRWPPNIAKPTATAHVAQRVQESPTITAALTTGGGLVFTQVEPIIAEATKLKETLISAGMSGKAGWIIAAGALAYIVYRQARKDTASP